MIRFGLHTTNLGMSRLLAALPSTALEIAVGRNNNNIATSLMDSHALPSDWASNVSTYKWMPLQNHKDIRVVHIYPAEDQNATMVIRITTNSKDKLPEYTGLSYHWGDPQPIHDVAVLANDTDTGSTGENGLTSTLNTNKGHLAAQPYQKVTIPHNLLVALQHLRHSFRKVLIWTDFLCINQKDILEKNEQVLRMHQIYSSAVSTTVFLGEASPDDHSDEMHNILSQISDWLQNGYIESGLDPERYAREFSKRIQDGIEDSGLFPEISTAEEKWRHFQIAIRRFFARPWFKRVWVVQEVFPTIKGHDRSRLHLFCGKQKLDMQEIMFAYVLNSWMPLTNTEDEEGGHAPVFQLVHRLEKYLSLFELLCHSQELLASDPRDHCFGLISMLDVSHVPELKPDYSIDVREVFMRYTRFLIGEGFGQSLLMRAIKAEYMKPHVKPVSGLPSWAPDWSIPPSYEMPFSPQPHLVFAAGGRSSGNFVLRGDDLLLTQGVIFDRVTAATHLESYDSPELDRFEEQIRTELQHLDWASRVLIRALFELSNGNFQGDIAAFIIRFLTLDLNPGASRRLEDILTEAYDIVPSLLDRDWETLDKCLENHEAQHYLSNMFGNFRRSSIAVTARGYVARVPRTIELSDVIAIIVGCDVPLILSEVLNDETSATSADIDRVKQYRIKDWAFVPGIMDGEVFRSPQNTIVDIPLV